MKWPFFFFYRSSAKSYPNKSHWQLNKITSLGSVEMEVTMGLYFYAGSETAWVFRDWTQKWDAEAEKVNMVFPGPLFPTHPYPALFLLQFSSVAQSCPTLCDPMNHSMPGLPVHHQLTEFTQTHVHRVGDAIQTSYPLSSPSPPAPNPSQHQGLFQWVNSFFLAPLHSWQHVINLFVMSTSDKPLPSTRMNSS